MLKKLRGLLGACAGAGEISAYRERTADPIAPISRMKSTLAMLEQRETRLKQLAQEEKEKADTLLSKENRPEAKLCLKKRAMYLRNAEQV